MSLSHKLALNHADCPLQRETFTVAAAAVEEVYDSQRSLCLHLQQVIHVLYRHEV